MTEFRISVATTSTFSGRPAPAISLIHAQSFTLNQAQLFARSQEEHAGGAHTHPTNGGRECATVRGLHHSEGGQLLSIREYRRRQVQVQEDNTTVATEG